MLRLWIELKRQTGHRNEAARVVPNYSAKKFSFLRAGLMKFLVSLTPLIVVVGYVSGFKNFTMLFVA
jgi:hypothetical protein